MEGNSNLTTDSSDVLNLPDMNYERRRLETFRFWPSNSIVEPARIAKAGFFSTGNDLEVRCFSCGQTITEWNYGDQVMARHRAINPRCSFVLKPLECGNVPILPPLGQQSVDLRKEAERLLSFRGWPCPEIVTPEDLARNGLFYLREGDKVQCYFCAVVLHAWQPGDDPLEEHRRASSNCPLLFGYNVGNVPLGIMGSGIRQDQEAQAQERSPSPQQPVQQPENTSDITGSGQGSGTTLGNNASLARNPQFGAQAHKPPIHSRYQTYEARLATFESHWPEERRPSAQQLASAGFFYHGTLDHTTCFHCNGGLHNWDPEDAPWEEHARWFPLCPYVCILKGAQFIRRAIAKKPPVLPVGQLLGSVANGVSQHGQDGAAVQAPATGVESSTLPARQDSEPEGYDETGLMPLMQSAGHDPVSELLASLLAQPDLAEETWTQDRPRETQGLVTEARDRPAETTVGETRNTPRITETEQSSQETRETTDVHSNRRSVTDHSEVPSSELPATPGTSGLNRRHSSGQLVVRTTPFSPSPTPTSSAQATEGEATAEAPSLQNLRVSNTVTASPERTRLVEENRRLAEARLCKVCLDEEVGVVFLPCGHLISCPACASNLAQCPMCRTPIQATVRTFFS